MAYLNVVLNLPVEGPFDYLVPEELNTRIKLGARCLVPFRNKRMLGFIVGICEKTSVAKVKPVYRIIDDLPLLSEEMLKLTKEVAQYYCCSWGEAVAAALPAALRKAKAVDLVPFFQTENKAVARLKNQTTLIHDLSAEEKRQIYLRHIQEKLGANKEIIVLTPQIESALEMQRNLREVLKQDIALLHSQQTTSESLSHWQKIRNNKVNVAVGTRLAVFSPVNNLGLIILDNEEDPAFKQDQTPHYHAREVALMRAELNQADLILTSVTPSLESFYLAKKKKKAKYIFIEKKSFPQITILDTGRYNFYRNKGIFSLPLQNILFESLQRKEKAIIFLNRKGFATLAACPRCLSPMRCPRCNVNLVYHFKENTLNCHYCNYKTQAPKICPHCNAGYIRYSGMGSETIESELTRLFPQAKVLLIDKENKDIPPEADILISTAFMFGQHFKKHDLIVVAAIDNALNRCDFRATEKAFALLMQLVAQSPKRLIVQTRLPQHYCFNAIKNADVNLFYDKELILRRHSGFPPYSHLALIKIRGGNYDKVKAKAELLFEKLRNLNQEKTIRLVSCSPGQPAKLRGNFYWQILIKAKRIEKVNIFLKKHLKEFPHSGIIITVDIDPL